MSKRILGLVLLSLMTIVGCGKNAKAPAAPQSAPTFAAFLEIDVGSGAGPTPTPDCNQACQKLRQEFRYVVYAGKQIYCYWDQKKAETGTDFYALAAQLEQSITNKTTPTDYYLTLRAWASAFHDGHVNVMMKSDHSDIELYTAPVRLEILAPATDHEKVVVVEVKGEYDLKGGDVVTAVDGVPIKEALDKAASQVSGSTARMRRFFAARRLVDAMGAERAAQPLELSILRDTATGAVVLERSAEIAPKPDPKKGDSEKETSGAEQIKALVLPGGLGYLRIDGFSGAQSFFLLEQALERLSATKGLLIDLRKNGGGDQSGNSIISHLIRNTVTRYRTSERMSDFMLASRPEYYFLPWTAGSPFADWHDLTVKPKESPKYLDKPVMALTSANCFSACDTFTAGLKANGLATIVGEATGGGTGTPLVFDLPHSKHRFRYSVVRGLTAKGEPIEGVGTSPDHVIEPAVQDRKSGKDGQLVRALELLGGRAGVSKPSNSSVGAAVESITPVWQQSFSYSPTTADELSLGALVDFDELP